MDNKFILTLDNGINYVEFDKINFEGTSYTYLINFDNPEDYMIGILNDTKFTKVEDEELLGKIIVEFAKKVEAEDKEG